MWPRPTEVTAVGVSTGAVVALSRAGTPGIHAVAEDGHAEARHRDLFARALTDSQSTSAGSVVVAVASDLARHWIQEPPRGVSSLRELRQVAAIRFEQLFGETADRWLVTGDWRASGAFMCAAVPSWLVDACNAALAPRQRLASVQTVLALASGARGLPWPVSGWWCVSTPTTTTVGHSSDGRPDLVRCSLKGHADRKGGLEQDVRLVRRESARAGGEVPGELFRLDLDLDGHPIATQRERVDSTHVASVGLPDTVGSQVMPSSPGAAEALAAARVALHRWVAA